MYPRKHFEKCPCNDLFCDNVTNITLMQQLKNNDNLGSVHANSHVSDMFWTASGGLRPPDPHPSPGPLDLTHPWQILKFRVRPRRQWLCRETAQWQQMVRTTRDYIQSVSFKRQRQRVYNYVWIREQTKKRYQHSFFVPRHKQQQLTTYDTVMASFQHYVSVDP